MSAVPVYGRTGCVGWWLTGGVGHFLVTGFRRERILCIIKLLLLWPLVLVLGNIGALPKN